MERLDLMTLFKDNTDCHFVLAYLVHHAGWCNVIDILRSRSVKPVDMVNWAARSRISNIRKRIQVLGWDVRSRIGINGQGEYMLSAGESDEMAELKKEIRHHVSIDRDTADKVAKLKYSIDELKLIKRHLDTKPLVKKRYPKGEQLEIPS